MPLKKINWLSDLILSKIAWPFKNIIFLFRRKWFSFDVSSADFFTLTYLIESRLINLLLTFATLIFISCAQRSVGREASRSIITQREKLRPGNLIQLWNRYHQQASGSSQSIVSFGFPRGNENTPRRAAWCVYMCAMDVCLQRGPSARPRVFLILRGWLFLLDQTTNPISHPDCQSAWSFNEPWGVGFQIWSRADSKVMEFLMGLSVHKKLTLKCQSGQKGETVKLLQLNQIG